jgi:Na+/melibiose symporter-like transporter
MLIEGVIFGVLALNEFVFVKSLKGSNIHLGFLFQFSMLVFLFLIFFNEFLRRVRKRRRLLRRLALATRLPLLLLVFFPRNPEAYHFNSHWHYLFLALFLAWYLAAPIVNPSINLFLKSNYRHEQFGRLFSISTTLNKVIMMVVTFLYGLWLDFDPYAFTTAYPIVAGLGVLSLWSLSKIPFEAKAVNIPQSSFLKSVRDSVRDNLLILKRNKPYLHFEIGFMLYGIAFMSSVTLLPVFYEHNLHLNYSSVAFYRNSYNILAIAMLPFFGRLIGRIDPRHFASLTFVSIVIYLFTLILTSMYPAYTDIGGLRIYYMMLLFVLFHGVFAATMALMWNIGSSYFCKPEEAGDYQSVHLSLTGFRAIFAPFAGVFIYEAFGFGIAFGFAIACLLLAIVIMQWSVKHDKRLVINN